MSIKVPEMMDSSRASSRNCGGSIALVQVADFDVTKVWLRPARISATDERVTAGPSEDGGESED